MYLANVVSNALTPYVTVGVDSDKRN